MLGGKRGVSPLRQDQQVVLLGAVEEGGGDRHPARRAAQALPSGPGARGGDGPREFEQGVQRGIGEVAQPVECGDAEGAALLAAVWSHFWTGVLSWRQTSFQRAQA